MPNNFLDRIKIDLSGRSILDGPSPPEAWIETSDLEDGQFELLSASSKVRRAYAHISNLARDQIFITSKENIGSVEAKSYRNGKRYYLAKAERYPLGAAIAIGDIVGNLRAALDHIASSFVPEKERRNGKDVAFPIMDAERSSSRGHSLRWHSATWGMNDVAKRFIDRHQPYPSYDHQWVPPHTGTHLLEIVRASNRDKHKRLVELDIWMDVVANVKLADGSHVSYRSSQSNGSGKIVIDGGRKKSVPILSYRVKDGEEINLSRLYSRKSLRLSQLDRYASVNFKLLGYPAVKGWQLPSQISCDGDIIQDLVSKAAIVSKIVRESAENYERLRPIE